MNIMNTNPKYFSLFKKKILLYYFLLLFVFLYSKKKILLYYFLLLFFFLYSKKKNFILFFIIIFFSLKNVQTWVGPRVEILLVNFNSITTLVIVNAVSHILT